MKHKFEFVDKELCKAKAGSLYRRLQYGTVCGPHITIGSKTLLNLCSNDYLGMPASPIGARQMQSSSRLVSGNDSKYRMLERRIARHKSCQQSLVYPTGYMANLGVIPSLAGRGDLILSDELNHASIIEACKMTGARTAVYSHNSMDDLGRKIRQGAKNKFIVTEGVFSMDGDSAMLPQITEVAQREGAITILDDAHGDFVLGRDGRGTAHKMHVARKIDIYTGSLSKGLGSFGGYVASKSGIIQLLINKSRPFIYTSALPAALVEHALDRINSDRERYRRKLFRNITMLAAGLQRAGYRAPESHIMPIIIGGERKALDVGRFLYDNGIFVRPIRYPTVPRNGARLRVTVTAWLSEGDIERAVAAFERAAKRFGI